MESDSMVMLKPHQWVANAAAQADVFLVKEFRIVPVIFSPEEHLKSELLKAVN